MNRIEKKFAELKETGRAALMPYLPLGYPSIESSQRLIQVASEEGADVIELGMPFSDPLADGPVIQQATQVALKNGMTIAKCLEMVRQARLTGVTVPLVMMGYYNPILHFGPAAFAETAAKVGADGVIVPDLPPEHAGDLSQACREHGLDLIFLAAPTSTPARLELIAHASRGFVYLVSVTGVTGERDQVAGDLRDFVARVRAITQMPVCVGFGIGSQESAAYVARIADGVIVGSALVSRIGQGGSVAAGAFIQELRAAVET